MSTVETKTETVTFKSINARDGNGSWARVLWLDSGRVIILSDYGTWSYYWGHRGESTVPQFLADLDKHYMGGKMLGADLWQHDDKATCQAIRETIIEKRRDGSLDRDEARNEWEAVKSYESGDYDFRGWVEASGLYDAWELARREVCSEWEQFWIRLWVPLIQPALTECG